MIVKRLSTGTCCCQEHWRSFSWVGRASFFAFRAPESAIPSWWSYLVGNMMKTHSDKILVKCIYVRWRGSPLAPDSQGGCLNSLCYTPIPHSLTVNDDYSSLDKEGALLQSAELKEQLKASKSNSRVYSVDEMLKTCHDKYCFKALRHYVSRLTHV